MLEIEKRGKLTKSRSEILRRYLLSNGKLVRKSNQLNIFIEFNNPFLGSIENTKASINISITKNLSDNSISCKLKSKTGNMQSGTRAESNISFDLSEINQVFDFLKIFQITEGCPRFYYREDYKLGLMNISLKEKGLAPDHFEVDMEVEDPEALPQAEDFIAEFARDNELEFFTENEYKEIMLKVFKENPPIPLNNINLRLVN